MAGISDRAAFQAALDHFRQPFAWGLRRDCTVACVAFQALHGTDPLGDCADRYATRLGAARILRRAGGYLGWCRATLRLPEVTDPAAGDLALIASADAFGAALTLCITPGVFAGKTETGMVVTRAKVLGGWSCRSYRA